MIEVLHCFIYIYIKKSLLVCLILALNALGRGQQLQQGQGQKCIMAFSVVNSYFIQISFTSFQSIQNNYQLSARIDSTDFSPSSRFGDSYQGKKSFRINSTAIFVPSFTFTQTLKYLHCFSLFGCSPVVGCCIHNCKIMTSFPDQPCIVGLRKILLLVRIQPNHRQMGDFALNWQLECWPSHLASSRVALFESYNNVQKHLMTRGV